MTQFYTAIAFLLSFSFQISTCFERGSSGQRVQTFENRDYSLHQSTMQYNRILQNQSYNQTQQRQLIQAVNISLAPARLSTDVIVIGSNLTYTSPHQNVAHLPHRNLSQDITPAHTTQEQVDVSLLISCFSCFGCCN